MPTPGGPYPSGKQPSAVSAADAGLDHPRRRLDAVGATIALLVVSTTTLTVTALLTPIWTLAPAILVVLASARLAQVLRRTGRRLTRQNDALRRTTATLEKITAERNSLHSGQTELQRLAHRDPVTGLGNRLGLEQRGNDLGDGLATAALLLLDLDGFKEVNDTLGHALGDDLLRKVGQRLSSCVRSHDDVVRIGGDEFVVLLGDTSIWTGAQTAERILDAVRRPFPLAEQSVQVRGSIGLAAGGPNATLGDLLRDADVAMYAAKAQGKDCLRIYETRMSSGVAERFALDAEVRTALANDEFEVYYQPIVDARTGRVESVEALVRWEHQTRGTIPPAAFLDSAHRSGLIVELGQFVLRAACEQTAAWRHRRPWLSVAVNASHRELMHEEFAAQVVGILAASGLEPSALCIEVTETVLAVEDDIDDVLRPLRALGVQCSLDDFGTGQSSLSRLGKITVDKVKIDKSFVDPVEDNSSPAAPLLASIVHLSHSLGLRVVAEGVETRGQADFLTDHGCDQLQGYYFARPQPPEACDLGPDPTQPGDRGSCVNAAASPHQSRRAQPVFGVGVRGPCTEAGT